MLFDDRPMFTPALSMSEMIALRGALLCANLLCEGNDEALAAWLDANRGDYDVAQRDQLADRLETLFMPVAKQRLAEVMQRAAERREDDSLPSDNSV